MIIQSSSYKNSRYFPNQILQIINEFRIARLQLLKKVKQYIYLFPLFLVLNITKKKTLIFHNSRNN